MQGLSLYGPLENIENPSEEYLRRMIFEFDEQFWDTGCGEMALNMSRPAGFPAGQPTLILFFEPGAGFFFQFERVDGVVLVPYDGTGWEDLISHHVGGEPFWVPRACCVSREMAWQIIKHYADHREPSPLVNWVPFEDLKYVPPGYEQ